MEINHPIGVLNSAVLAVVAVLCPVPRNSQMMETTFTGVAVAILIVVSRCPFQFLVVHVSSP